MAVNYKRAARDALRFNERLGMPMLFPEAWWQVGYIVVGIVLSLISLLTLVDAVIVDLPDVRCGEGSMPLLRTL